jgi:hypothetical protein
MVLRVVVTEDTEFEGVAGLGGLVLGAFVKVEGTLTDVGFVASEVEVEDDDGDDDGDNGDNDDNDDGEDGEVDFEGQITELFDDGFTLQTGSTTVRVVVTDDTEFDGVAGLAELAVGDVVEVEGTWTDLGFIASKVKVEEDDLED